MRWDAIAKLATAVCLAALVGSQLWLQSGAPVDLPEQASTPAVNSVPAGSGTTRPIPQPAVWIKPEISAARRDEIRSMLPAFDDAAETEVPLASLSTPRTDIRLLLRPAGLASAIDVTGRGRFEFPRPGVPLEAVEIDRDRLAIVFREFFSSKLFVYVIGAGIEREISLASTGDSEPIFRAATTHGGQLLVSVYDNERSVNEIRHVELSDRAQPAERPAIVLPSLEDPAGRTYEMIPKLRFVRTGQRLWVIGGNLVAEVPQDAATTFEPLRIPGCLRAQDIAVAGDDIVILCLTRAEGPDQPYATGGFVVDCKIPPYHRVRWSPQFGFRQEALAASFGLPMLSASGALEYARTPAELASLLYQDLVDNHASGVMELGTNNVEGRVAWSQIYALNGLLDLILLATSHEPAADLLRPLAAAAKRRVDIEIYLLDRLVASPLGFRTKGFTAKRQPALFAVQTSRLLLLFERYRREIDRGSSLASLSKLRASVMALEGHIEEVAVAGPASKEPRPGLRYLRWPKGSAFYFDGLNVPYNHQNEWAYAVFDSLQGREPEAATERRAREIAAEIIQQFIESVAPGGAMPASGMWPYWWGDARDGWTAEQGFSVNMPAYPGDKLIAWISFRSIDVMSVLGAKEHVAMAAEPDLRRNIGELAARGLVYPFVAAGLLKQEGIPLMHWTPALSHARLNAPSDLQSGVWAILSLALAGGHEPARTRCN